MNALGRIFGALERRRHRDKNDSSLSVTENFKVEKAAHLVSQVPNFVVLLFGRKGEWKDMHAQDCTAKEGGAPGKGHERGMCTSTIHGRFADSVARDRRL